MGCSSEHYLNYGDPRAADCLEQGALQPEEPLLAVEAAAVAGEAAVRAHHAVAREDDRQRVAVHHRADRSCRPRPGGSRRQLDEYFAGGRQHFDLAVDLALQADFNRRVLRELARVPYGEVVTYGELAARAARPRAARAVGTVMNRNPLPIVLPCHRVIGANGKLVGYAGGLERKESLLRLEGALL